jgi:hypothetical protein
VLVERLQNAILEEASASVDESSTCIDESPEMEDGETPDAHASKRPKTQSALILVLGDGLQHIPWEAMPVLQQASVSRMPSLPLVFAHAELRAQKLCHPKASKHRKWNVSRDGARLCNSRYLHRYHRCVFESRSYFQALALQQVPPEPRG